MMLSDRTVNLAEDHVDMAIRLGNLPDSSVIATRVGSVRRVICGSPDYFKANARVSLSHKQRFLEPTIYASSPIVWRTNEAS